MLGTRQWFVRTAGCSVRKCPIRAVCDERFALHAVNGSWHVVADLVDEALAAVGTGGWMHITGGEPTDQPEALAELLAAARAAGLRTHVQTSGLREIDAADFVTVSPKVPADEVAVLKGDELVLVYNEQSADEIRAYERLDFSHYFLQPKWDTDSEANAPETAKAVLDTGGAWRLTVQAHKYVGIR